MGCMRRNIIAVKTRPGEVRFVAVASIERVEAFGNYVKIYFGNERVLHRATLSDMEELLDDRFIRIHRSHIVKRDQLRKLLSERERKQKEGIVKAQQKGLYHGRQPDLEAHDRIASFTEAGFSINKTAEAVGVSRSTVIRVRKKLKNLD